MLITTVLPAASSRRQRSPVERSPLASLSKRPLVSIVVPSFNQGQFIRQTIDSILEQDYRPVEVIVMDGGSRDGTVDVLRSYGRCPELLWVSEPDRGVADAVNKGFARARGEVIGIQSSDDRYLPGALSQAVNALQSSGASLVYSDVATIDVSGRELRRSSIAEFSLVGLLTQQTWIPQPSAFFRADVLEVLHGWDARYFCCDTEFWLRAAFRFPVRRIAGLWSQRRLHSEQRNCKSREIVESYARMVRESCDLKAAPMKLRRAARCGAHLIRARYNPAGSYWMATLSLWRAIAAYPEILPSVWRSPLLIPGRLPLAICRNRIAQVLKRMPGFGRRRPAGVNAAKDL